MKKILLFIMTFILFINVKALEIDKMYIDSEIDISGNLMVKEIIEIDNLDEDFNYKLYFKDMNLKLKDKNYYDGVNIKINKIGLLKRVLFRDFYGNVTTDLNEIYDIVCTINMSNLDKINDIKDELNFLCSTPFFHILVFSEEMDKIDGIDVVVSSECIDDKHVFTIGNDFFDRNMIEKYNGYRMINSNILLRKNGIRKVSSVRRLIRSI